jgi:hypothetical protein
MMLAVGVGFADRGGRGALDRAGACTSILLRSLIGNICAGPSSSSGWSQSTYDAARAGIWAALIVGAVLVMLGLIGFAQRGREV